MRTPLTSCPCGKRCWLARVAGRAVSGRHPFLFALSVLLAVPAWSEPLLVTYVEKPPYYFSGENGRPSGFLLERMKAVLDAASIDYRLESRPPNRVLHEMRGRQPVCSIGWFRNAERERIARYSEPIHHDRPMVGAMLRKRTRQVPVTTLAGMLAQPELRIGLVSGFSYGEELDRLFASLGPRIDPAPSPESNLRKLAAGRFDVGIFDAEELDHLLRGMPAHADEVLALALPDMPPGRTRYLMCNRLVPETTLAAVNAGLVRLRLAPPSRR